ncbi:MAG: ribose-phosphate pyrophosphokinae [Moraxellaceae bacterium]|jgi:ribose-phosphate pyrophosphokinase|nr:ribose-phosphate pyrophosphokinae [Moraxellaceae bacterium]
MSLVLLLAYPGNEALARSLADALGGECATLALHRFPDGETLVTLPAVAGRRVQIVCSLDRPDAKLAPLLFAADAAREQGATQVGLVAPYLAYMRQDRRFHPGEAVTSRTFAAVLSQYFDSLVTVDPHLHRYHALDEIYRMPARAASASAAIAAWIHREVERPVLIGPDEESAQWVQVIAAREGLPHTVLSKVRHDDFHVEVSLPDAAQWAGHTPVLVDDIISSAHTMIAAVRRLQQLGFAQLVCVGVHAIFAGSAHAELQAAGAGRIVTCNCVPHASNAIDVMPAVAEAVAQLHGR